MVELKWQDPPTRIGGRGQHYDSYIDQLKQNPGRWALITDDWKTSSAPAAFRQAGCEASTRRNEGKKTWSVYARWPAAKVGPAPEPVVDAAKEKVREAVRTGTALTPPPAAAPRRAAPAAPPVRPANDFGMSQFLADRHARGVPAEGQ